MRRTRHDERAEYEEHIGQSQAWATAIACGDEAGKKGADKGGGDGDGDNESVHVGVLVEAKVILHLKEGTVDDTCVVAKEKATEGGTDHHGHLHCEKIIYTQMCKHKLRIDKVLYVCFTRTNYEKNTWYNRLQ